MKREPAELLKALVRIDTTNPPGGEAKLLAYLEELFNKEGIPCVLQESTPGRGNLLAWLSETDTQAGPPLILLSHVDVVAAQEKQWRFPPFAAHEEDGYIYGRGTVDTKQLTVMELTAFLALHEAGGRRKRPVYFLATSDEESGSAWGLQWFLEHEICVDGRMVFGRELFAGSDVISEGGGFPIKAGEKEFYLCENRQKGCGVVEFTVKARKAKGPFFGSGDGMARAMGLVQEIGAKKLPGAVLKTVRQFEEKLSGAELSAGMERIRTAMKHNTMTVTLISGKNVNEVKVTCDVRLLPGFGREWLEEILQVLAAKWDCEYRIVSLGQGYESCPEGGMAGLLEEATKEELGEAGKAVSLLPFVSMGSSDGRFLVGSGARVYGYSPVLSWDMTFDSAVSMVHGTDERIHKDSLAFGCRVLTRATERAARG